MEVNEYTTRAQVPSQPNEYLEAPIDVCPFCGNTDELEVIQTHVAMYAVQCNACFSRGPVDDTPYQAIQLWNRCYREQSYFDLPVNGVERRESIVTYTPLPPKAKKHAKNSK